MFAEFEKIMGRMNGAGEALTADALSEKVSRAQQAVLGPDMVSDDGIALEWARIPHSFYNYYVFQYATGFSAAVAIANRILAEGEPAVADYKKFLSSGGSADPISLLKIAGVDMSTPKPVNDALALFGEHRRAWRIKFSHRKTPKTAVLGCFVSFYYHQFSSLEAAARGSPARSGEASPISSAMSPSTTPGTSVTSTARRSVLRPARDIRGYGRARYWRAHGDSRRRSQWAARRCGSFDAQ